jgi:antitoxin component of MazEF toxin-antitoxin module
VRGKLDMLTALIAKLQKLGNGRCLYFSKRLIKHLNLDEKDFLRVDFSEKDKIVITKATDIITDDEITDIIERLNLI